MGTSVSPNSEYLKKQIELLAWIKENHADFCTVEDKLSEPVVWVTDSKSLLKLVLGLKTNTLTQMDFLSDITAYDNKDRQDGPKRFVMVYQLFSTVFHTRVRIKMAVEENESAPTLYGVWRGANWLEREVYDMYGITFKGHPDLRRIMMDERFEGHPLRKEYPIKGRAPFSDSLPTHLEPHGEPL